MKILARTAIVTACATVLFLSGNVFAAVIDDFTEAPYDLGFGGAPAPYTVTDNGVGLPAHIIGGNRFTTLDKIAGTFSNPNLLHLVGEHAAYNSMWDSRGWWSIEYGLFSDLNADLTVDNDTLFIVNMDTADMPTLSRFVPLTITVISGHGTVDEASADVEQNLVAVGLYGFVFTDFTGVDFTDVDYIKFSFAALTPSQDAVDFSIRSLSTGGFGDIPEPATMFFGVVIAVSAVVSRRLKNRRAA